MGSATRRVRSLDVALVLALALLGACGTGAMQVHLAPEASADTPGGMDNAPVPDAVEAAEAPAETGMAPDAATDGEEREAPADVADAPTDVAADRSTAEVSMGSDAPAEAQPDVPTERPNATASWTIAPNPMCVAAGAGCMDTGAVGGYQITASGNCPTSSDVQLWFPGGASPLAAGTYTVKPASGILDVIAMPAGMVGVLAERDDASQAHSAFWGRAGTITVTAAGTARHVTFSGVSVQEATTSAMTTLAGDVSCP